MKVNNSKSVRHFLKECFKFYKHFRYNLIDNKFNTGEKLFFITGRSKTGTTWLCKMLNVHPRIFCSNHELNPFHQDMEIRYYQNDVFFLHENAKAYFYHSYNTLIRNGFITTLISKCNKLNAQLLGDKSPRQDVIKIMDVFPRAKILITLRDTRDVLVSLAFHNYRERQTWKGIFSNEEMQSLDNRFIIKYLSNYKIHNDVQKYLLLRKRFPEKVLLVKYEDMKESPRKTLSSIFSFLGVTQSEKIVNKAIHETSFNRLSKGRKAGENDNSSFFRKGIVGDYQNYFDESNMKTFAKIAKDELSLLNYE